MRNVIVTGGTRGIGLGIAKKLAASGFRVIAVARTNSSELLSAEDDAVDSNEGGELHFRVGDLSETETIKGLIKGIKDEFGPLYGLVNNAGGSISGVLANTRDDQIERLMRLNVLAPILLAKYASRSMLANGAGRIVNIASVVASTGYSGLSAYSASKAALVGFTKSLARELGPLGITVNAVAPGFVDTDLTQGMPAEQKEKIMRRSALQRLVDVNDVANAVDFLCSEKACHITGIVMTVDAGNTA